MARQPTTPPTPSCYALRVAYINELAKRINVKVALLGTDADLAGLKAFHDRVSPQQREDFHDGALNSGRVVSWTFGGLGKIRGFQTMLHLLGTTASSAEDLAVIGKGADAAILTVPDERRLALAGLGPEVPVVRGRGEPVPTLIKEAAKLALNALKEGGSSSSRPPGPAVPSRPPPHHYPVDVGPYRVFVPDFCPGAQVVGEHPVFRLEGVAANGVAFGFTVAVDRGQPEHVDTMLQTKVRAWNRPPQRQEDLYLEGVRFVGVTMHDLGNGLGAVEERAGICGSDLITLTLAYGYNGQNDDRVRSLFLMMAKGAILRRIHDAPELFRSSE